MSKTQHEKLISRAEQSLRRVWSDTSVSPEEILNSLEYLEKKLDDFIMVVKADLERRK